MQKSSPTILQRFIAAGILFWLSVLGIYSCAHRNEAAHQAEADRRAKLTPEQRAEEDRVAAAEKAAKDEEVKIFRLKIEAERACKNYVRDSLKWPDDASFPWLSGEVTSNKQGDVFGCQGTVKAKNGFGAELTYHWGAIVFLDDNTWQLVTLTINGETMADHPELVKAIAIKHGEKTEEPSVKASREPERSGPAAEMPPGEPPPEPETELRTWSDSTGKFTIEARFIGTDGVDVMLRKPDGKKITLPREKLSEKDQQWIDDLLSRPGTENSAGQGSRPLAPLGK
jgi:hypothetical protein